MVARTVMYLRMRLTVGFLVENWPVVDILRGCVRWQALYSYWGITYAARIRAAEGGKVLAKRCKRWPYEAL